MNGPSFTRGEYWLLETVVEAWVPLCLLVHPDVTLLFNKPAHALSPADLLTSLERLVERGFIRAKTNAQDPFAPTRTQLAAALDQPRDARWDARTYYGLTGAGGSAWEAFAAPDWSRRIDSSSDGESRYEVIGVDREWMDRYLAALWREGTLDEATLVRDEVAPWAATYWKELPLGHRARFVCVGAHERRPPVASGWYCDWYQWG